MKKFILPILTILFIAIASCTKKDDDNKEDEYKNILTNGEWTMSTSSMITDTTTKHDYSNGQSDEVFTIRKTITISTTTRREETYKLQQEVGSADFFQKETDFYHFSRRYKFDQGGIYSANEYKQLVSYTYEETGIPATTTPVTQPTGTSSESKSWSLKNVNGLKYILTFDLGALEVQSISENKLTLAFSTSDSKTSVISPFETKTVDRSQTINITMIR